MVDGNAYRSLAPYVHALAMLGHSKLFSPEQKIVNEQKINIMNQSKIENIQPEQVNDNEQTADNKHVSPSIANALVGGSMGYDSSADTLLHIKRVNELLIRFSKDLMCRAICHDNSKLREPEKSLFDEFTPKLKNCTYGSDEYKQFLSSLKVALENHYKHNSHHPEHYENGVDGMDLLDLVEMFMDWKAAGERHADGNILKSIEHNKDRFKLSEQVVSIFKNTARNYGW